MSTISTMDQIPATTPSTTPAVNPDGVGEKAQETASKIFDSTSSFFARLSGYGTTALSHAKANPGITAGVAVGLVGVVALGIVGYNYFTSKPEEEAVEPVEVQKNPVEQAKKVVSTWRKCTPCALSHFISRYVRGLFA